MGVNLKARAHRLTHYRSVHYRQRIAYLEYINEEPSLRSFDTRQKRMTF